MLNGAVFKPLKGVFVWTAVFSMSNTIISHVLKPKLCMKMCSCPLERMYCLKKCPGVHFTLAKCCSVPLTKLNFCRVLVFNVITIYINIPIPANKCMQYSKQKCSIPFFISAIFLWSNAVCFCRTISLWNIKCSFKRYTMPFGGVQWLQCAFNKISSERGTQGERGPGLEASKINFDWVFAFVWKTRSKLILGASRR